jgi:hypothetical protein
MWGMLLVAFVALVFLFVGYALGTSAEKPTKAPPRQEF